MSSSSSVPSSSTKKTISEYIEQLKPYGMAQQLAHGRPQNFKLSGDTLFWLQGTPLELYCFNEKKDTAPRRAIEESDTSSGGGGAKEVRALSKEEELIRERTRSRVTGIEFYRVRSSDTAIFYSVNSELYYYYFDHPTYVHKGPFQLSFAPEDLARYPSLLTSPKLFYDIGKTTIEVEDERKNIHARATFVNDYNLYDVWVNEQLQKDQATVTPIICNVRRITQEGDALHPIGVADYIIQEEFGRLIGHTSSANNRYLLFSYTDCSQTREVTLLRGTAALGETVPPAEVRNTVEAYHQEEEDLLERMAYPRVGDLNARMVLCLHDRLEEKDYYIPPAALQEAAPWYEYVPRFGFKDDKTIVVSLLSRTQEEYAVLCCPTEGLPVYAPDRKFTDVLQDKDCHGVKFGTEWRQTIPWGWVEVLPGPPIRYGPYYDFILCHDTFTETGAKTAHYHIFYRKKGGDAESWLPLTTGAWNVIPSSVTIAEKGEVTEVYFTANAHDRLGKRLYRLSVSHSHPPASPFTADTLVALSPADEHLYSYCTSPDDRVYYLSATATAPPQLYKYTVAEEGKGATTVVPLPNWMKHATFPSLDLTPYKGLPQGTPLAVPTIVTVENGKRVPLSAQLFLPPITAVQDPSRPLPLVLYVYGGPHVQLVYRHDYYSAYNPIVQVAVHGGMAVAIVDNTMSNANGLVDLSTCKHRMGTFETQDYVTMVNHLTASPVVLHHHHHNNNNTDTLTLQLDPKRVAVFGWSYGGYSTLLAMAQAPEVFKLGLAGAPVGDWRLYDTGYTERYMGLLTEEEEEEEGRRRRENETQINNNNNVVSVRRAYLEAAISHYAKGFPDDLNRVFIAHGLLDENVHFMNSCAVMEAMIKEGKPFHCIAYPGERHGLRQHPYSRKHHDGHLLKVLHEIL